MRTILCEDIAVLDCRMWLTWRKLYRGKGSDIGFLNLRMDWSILGAVSLAFYDVMSLWLSSIPSAHGAMVSNALINAAEIEMVISV